jgi:hypothetical protein
MSGHKRTTVTISEEEYRKLHEAQMSDRFSEGRKNEILQSIRQETQHVLQNHIMNVDFRQKDYQKSLNEISDDLYFLEETTNQSILSQNRIFETQIEGLSIDVRSGMENLVEQQSLFYENLLTEERKRQNEFNYSLQEKFSNLELDREEKSSIAIESLRSVKELAVFIENSYPLRFDQKPILEGFQRRINQAELNLNSGLSESTITQAQQLFMDLSDERILLEKLEMQWNLLLQTAREKASYLLQFAKDQQNVFAIYPDGKTLPYTLDVDFWNGGAYATFIDYVNQLNEQLQSPGAYVELSVLEDLIKITFPELENELDSLIFNTRMKAIQSQMRINIADIVLQAFFEQGYNLQAASYEAEDPRLRFEARLRHISGSEVVVQVDPGNGCDPRNDLHLFSLDQEVLTSHELHQRSREIRQALCSHGLELGATSTQPMNFTPVVQIDGKNEKRLRSEIADDRTY